MNDPTACYTGGLRMLSSSEMIIITSLFVLIALLILFLIVCLIVMGIQAFVKKRKKSNKDNEET